MINGDLTSTHTGSTPDITAGSVIIDTTGGSLGSASSPLLLQTSTLQATTTGTGSINVTNVAAGGNLSVTSATTAGGAINLSVAGGNLTTSGSSGSVLSAPGSTVTLTASGAILRGASSGVSDVTAQGLAATAGSGAGTSGSPLQTVITNLAAHGGTGGVFITNTGSLTVTTVGSLSGVNGGADITLLSGMTSSDDLTVATGATIAASAGNVQLTTGRTIQVQTGATVIAQAGTVAFLGGQGGPGGVSLLGSVTGTSISATGGTGADTFTLALTGGSGPLTADGAAGVDTYNVTPVANHTITISDSGTDYGDTLNYEASSQAVRTGMSPGRFSALNVADVIFSGTEQTFIEDAGGINSLYGPNTSSRATAMTGLTPQQRFVQQMYLNALGRAGSVDELNGWVAVFNGSGGQATVAAGIEGSPEARDHLVKSWYITYLGRPADGTEEQSLVSELLGGATEEQVISQLLGSSEFNSHAQSVASTGTSDENVVQALYQLLLDRSADSSELSAGVSSIGAEGQQSFALGILQSQEGRTAQFISYYNTLLNRPNGTPG
jgi:hypothetical protein